jgi:hypothetical protein
VSRGALYHRLRAPVRVGPAITWHSAKQEQLNAPVAGRSLDSVLAARVVSTVTQKGG